MMPLYYFHLRNGNLALDERGETFADDEAARREALVFIGEMLRDRGHDFWTTRSFTVVVTDEARQPVLNLTTTASDNFPEGWEEATAWGKAP